MKERTSLILLVSVGSTNFDSLIEECDNEEFHRYLFDEYGVSTMLLQIGTGEYEPRLSIECDDWQDVLERPRRGKYTSSFAALMQRSDIIVSHAGAGSITEAVMMSKILFVVINDTLMHNHQTELAHKVAELNVACVADTPARLHDVFEENAHRFGAKSRQIVTPWRDPLQSKEGKRALIDALGVASLDENDSPVMVVLGSGGHTAEMLRMLSSVELPARCSERIYVTAATDRHSGAKAEAFEEAFGANSIGHYSIRRLQRSREVKQSYTSSILTTLLAIFACFPLLWSARPRVILCNGPGTCIPILVVAYLLTRLHLISPPFISYVESVARVDHLSLSGKLIARFNLCDAFIVQWHSLVSEAPSNVIVQNLYFN